jgi:hypothetical protein
LLKIFLFPAIRAGLCFRPALAREYVSGTCLRFPEFTVWIYFYLAVLEAIHRENSRLAENSSFLCLQSPLGEIVVAVVEAELPPRMVDRNGQGPRAPRSVRTSSPVEHLIPIAQLCGCPSPLTRDLLRSAASSSRRAKRHRSSPILFATENLLPNILLKF